MKKILITGGAGFFGSKLVERLLKEHKVTVYDSLIFTEDGLKPFLKNSNYTFIKNDVTNLEFLKSIAKDFDIIIHAAAYVGEPICKANSDKVNLVNTLAAIELAKICDENNKQFLFLSTCSNYGVKPDELVNEESNISPSGYYSESKIAAETEIAKYPSSLIFRCATLFGVSHRMRVDLTINQFIYEIMQDGEIMLYGEHAWRPYVHVEDAANMIAIALEKKLTGIYNLGDNSLNYTKRQIINELYKNKMDFIVKPVEWNDPRDYQVDFAKIHKHIDYKIKYDLETGIKELTNFYKSEEFKRKTCIRNDK